MRLDGKVAIITGAAGGIGLATARRYLAEGARVAIADIDPRRVSAARDAVDPGGERTLAVTVDVTDRASIDAMVSAVLARFGRIDVLINNAGIFKNYETPLTQVPILELVDMYNVNTLGPLRVTRAMLPLLERSSRPVIVNISTGLASISDNTGGKAYGYRMSKAALNMFTKTVAMDYPRMICVAVDPGWVRTDMGGPNAPRSVDSAVRGLVRLIEDLKPDDSGMFLDIRGGETHW